MRAYPRELRERIVGAVEAGDPPDEVAEQFAVSVATVYRYLARRRQVGHLEPRPRHKDIYVAISDSFRAMRRQLQDYVRRLRGDVKTHAAAGKGAGEAVSWEEGAGVGGSER